MKKIKGKISVIKGFELVRDRKKVCTCPVRTFMLFSGNYEISFDDPILQMFNEMNDEQLLISTCKQNEDVLPGIYRTNINKKGPKMVRLVMFKNEENRLSRVRPMCWIQFVDEGINGKKELYSDLKVNFSSLNLFFGSHVVLKLIDSTNAGKKSVVEKNISFISLSVKGESVSCEDDGGVVLK